MEKITFVVITGLSGAGKTIALRSLEDLGYFCIDNLPPALVPRFVRLLTHTENYVDRVALAMDIRGGAFFEQATEALDAIERCTSDVRMLFLEAEAEVLINRFKETRRRHPLADEGSISEIIEKERRSLKPLRERAEHVVDTSDLGPFDLRKRVFALFGSHKKFHLLVSVVSFGFKKGMPRGADLVFDVRFLPNPHYADDLRPLTGEDPRIEEYVWSRPPSEDFYGRLREFISFLLPQYEREGKVQLTVALGCTGGRHRSVVLARRLGEDLREDGYPVVIEHRDIAAGSRDDNAGRLNE